MKKINRAPSLFTTRPVVFILAALCCCLWGAAYPAIKGGYSLFSIAAPDVPSKLIFAGYRFFSAGVVLLLFAAAMGQTVIGIGRRNFRRLFRLGFFQTAVQYMFLYIGLANTTGSKGAILNGTVTFFSVIIAHFLYRNERLKTWRVLGCLAGFSGVMLVNFGDDLLDFHFTAVGEGSVVLAAFIFAAASVYAKEVSQRMNVIVMAGWQLGIGGLILTVSGYATGGTLNGFTLASTSVLALLVLISSAAFALWSILLKYNPVGIVTVFNFLTPIAGAVLSSFFLSESIMDWKLLISLILVCLGIWMVTRRQT